MKLNNFHKSTKRWDKVTSLCKGCAKLGYNREYRKKYYENNREKTKKYRRNNKEKIAFYREQNRERNKKYQKKYRKENKDKSKKYYQKNKKKITAKNVANNRKRYHSDPLFRLKQLTRGRLHQALKRKGIRKSKATLKYFKCTWETLHQHIEMQFKQGMTWENHGSKWHVDHRIPFAAFKTEKGVSICSWYRNMQPLWKEENLTKKDKYKEEDKLLLVKSYITEFPGEAIEDVWNL